MAKNTSIRLGERFDGFIAAQLAKGRFDNATEVVRAALRLVEEHETQVQALQAALEEGARSGDAGALDFAAIKQAARERAGIAPHG
ncbi:MAG: type II toxin-antitoxin system ParD family antitoxin [Planctomycetota bacterium]